MVPIEHYLTEQEWPLYVETHWNSTFSENRGWVSVTKNANFSEDETLSNENFMHRKTPKYEISTKSLEPFLGKNFQTRTQLLLG